MLRKKHSFQYICLVVWSLENISEQEFFLFRLFWISRSMLGVLMCRIFFSTTMSYNGTCNSCSSGQYQNWRQILINITEQLTLYESAMEEVSFEWQHLRISSTDSKVRNCSHLPLVDFRSKKVKHSAFSTHINTPPNSSTPQSRDSTRGSWIRKADCVRLHQK